jgi:hypothetical protein
MRSMGRVILGDYVAWVSEYLPSASTSATLESGTQFRTARTNLLKHKTVRPIAGPSSLITLVDHCSFFQTAHSRPVVAF